MCELKPTNIDIENLKVFLFFTLLIQEYMKAGLPMYRSIAVGVSMSFKIAVVAKTLRMNYQGGPVLVRK